MYYFFWQKNIFVTKSKLENFTDIRTFMPYLSFECRINEFLLYLFETEHVRFLDFRNHANVFDTLYKVSSLPFSLHFSRQRCTSQTLPLFKFIFSWLLHSSRLFWRPLNAVPGFKRVVSTTDIHQLWKVRIWFTVKVC